MGKRIHRINLYAVNVNYYPTVIVNINYYPTLSGGQSLNMVLLKSSAMHLKKTLHCCVYTRLSTIESASINIFERTFNMFERGYHYPFNMFERGYHYP